MALGVHPRVWIETRRARREADEWIGHGFESRYPWRVAELTSERERRSCARALHHVVDEVRGSGLPGATPIRRAQLTPHLWLLEAIEARLRDGEPVGAIGMLAVDELLTSPGSCLFTVFPDTEARLRRVLDGLEAV